MDLNERSSMVCRVEVINNAMIELELDIQNKCSLDTNAYYSIVIYISKTTLLPSTSYIDNTWCNSSLELGIVLSFFKRGF